VSVLLLVYVLLPLSVSVLFSLSCVSAGMGIIFSNTSV
jgi:hypothetical protein